MAGSYDFIARQNEAFVQQLMYKVGNVPQDFSGWGAKMQVRPNPRGHLWMTISTGTEGGITLGPDAGAIRLHIADEDTVLIPVGEHYYDLILINNVGDNLRILEGKFTVQSAITL